MLQYATLSHIIHQTLIIVGYRTKPNRYDKFKHYHRKKKVGGGIIPHPNTVLPPILYSMILHYHKLPDKKMNTGMKIIIKNTNATGQYCVVQYSILILIKGT